LFERDLGFEELDLLSLWKQSSLLVVVACDMHALLPTPLDVMAIVVVINCPYVDLL